MSIRLRPLTAACCAAVLLPLLLAPAAPAAPAAVERAQATQAALEATSAELALARTRARALAGRELAANRRRQRALETRKVRLLAALRVQLPEAERAAARARRERAAARRRARAAATLAPATPGTVGTGTSGDDAALVRAIDGYLASKSSPLTGEGATFVRESRAVGLDPRLLVAISGAETAFGTYGPSQTIHNPFGMGPGIVYGSWAESIRAAARNLGGDLYLGSGLTTITAIHGRWAPVGASNDPGGLNGGWAANVSHYYAELGGDPSAPVVGTAASTATATTATTTTPSGPSPRRTTRPARRRGAVRMQTERAPQALESRVFADPGSGLPMLDAAGG